MIVIIILILIAYGILNIPYANQLASPFLAVVLIYFAVVIYNLRKENRELNNKIDDLKATINDNYNNLIAKLNNKDEITEKTETDCKPSDNMPQE